MPPGLRLVRLELHRLVECLEGVVMPPKFQERDAERRQIGRLRLLSDRARGPLDRMIELLCLRIHDTYEVHGFRIFRINREGLLAVHEGIERSSPKHLAKRGRMEHQYSLRRRHIPSLRVHRDPTLRLVGFAIFRSRSAFSTAHLRISSSSSDATFT